MINIEEDPKLQYIFETNKLAEASITSYKIVFNKVYEITGYTPSELLLKARKEQRNPFITIDGEKEYLEIEDRFVTQILFKFLNKLEEEQLKSTTIQTKQRILRAFFSFYHIDLPKPVPLIIPRNRIRKKDLPTMEDVKSAVDYSKNFRNKAMFLLLLTGLRSTDVRKLDIKTFKKACAEYMGTMSLSEFIRTDSSNIIPCFDIIPQKTRKHGNQQITFATPEFVKYIFLHLREREDMGLSLSDEEPLLMSYHSHGFLKRTAIASIFEYFNDTLFEGARVKDKRFFQAHHLRRYFRTTLKNNLKLIDEPGYNDMNIGDVVRIMSGHTPESGIEEAYDAIDVDVLKEYYLQVMDKFMMGEVPVETIKSPKYLKLEQKNLELEEKNKQHEKVLEAFDGINPERIREVFQDFK